jgi:hypothetical protein
MGRFGVVACFVLALCSAVVLRAAQAQGSPVDLRRTPVSMPDGHLTVPGEIPVQMPPPCADTTMIYQPADTLRGLQRPALILSPSASSVPDGLWHADFVIGTAGEPDAGSIVVTWNGKPSRDVRFHEVIEGLRFQPASLNGCAVRFKSGMDLQTEGG